MNSHIVNGQFQSDKYPSVPPDKVPLSVNDPLAQDLLWELALRYAKKDSDLSAAIIQRLLEINYIPLDPAARLILTPALLKNICPSCKSGNAQSAELSDGSPAWQCEECGALRPMAKEAADQIFRRSPGRESA